MFGINLDWFGVTSIAAPQKAISPIQIVQNEALVLELQRVKPSHAPKVFEMLAAAKDPSNSSKWVVAPCRDDWMAGQEARLTTSTAEFFIGAYWAKGGPNRLWEIRDTLSGERIADGYGRFGIAYEALTNLAQFDHLKLPCDQELRARWDQTLAEESIRMRDRKW